MHYLIDGHNLIAKHPDIDLDDPNDEMKLVLRLQSWASASRKRRVTVIFDRGLPGGKSLRFSNRDVKVIFASAGRTADALLINRIRQARNPAEFTLVSSDGEIIAAAKARRMPFLRSEQFVVKLDEHARRGRPVVQAAPGGKADKPEISEAEVAEWLALFGPEPERKPSEPQRQARPASGNAPKQRGKKGRHRPLKIKKTGDENLDADEVDAWLELFRRRQN